MNNITVSTALDFKKSIRWFKLAFVVFREKPIHFLLLEFINTSVMMLPFLSAFLTPLFIAKFMEFTQKINNSEDIVLKDILKIFKIFLLVRLGFISFSFSSLLLFIEYYLQSKYSTLSDIATLFIVLPALILALSLWLSPAICCFNRQVTPLFAMWLSIKGCMLNVLALLVYSLITVTISLLVLLPMILLSFWLWDSFHSKIYIVPCLIIGYFLCIIWFSILNIATYFAYQDIYCQE